MTTSIHLRKLIVHLQTPLQTLADPSNKINGKTTSTGITAWQLSNINTTYRFRIYQCVFFSYSWFCLPQFLHFRPLLAMQFATAGIPGQQGKRLGGWPTHKAYSRLARKASAFPDGQPHHGVATPNSSCTVSRFTSSSSILSRYLWRFPTTLLLQSDPKLPKATKTSFHWHQWFRGSAMLSRRNICLLIYKFYT